MYPHIAVITDRWHFSHTRCFISDSTWAFIYGRLTKERHLELRRYLKDATRNKHMICVEKKQ